MQTMMPLHFLEYTSKLSFEIPKLYRSKMGSSRLLEVNYINNRQPQLRIKKIDEIMLEKYDIN